MSRSKFVAFLFVLVLSALICGPSGLSAQSAGADIVLSEDIDGGCLDVAHTTITNATSNTPTINLGPRRDWPGSPTEWAWLMFRMDGVQGKTPQFQITTNYAAIESQHRLVYSYDDSNWTFFNNGSISSGYYYFSNNSAFTQDTVYVALGIPYQTWRTAQYLASIKTSPYVRPTPSGDANFIIGYTPGTGGRDANGNLWLDANGNPYTDFMGRVVPSMPIYAFMITDTNAHGQKTRVVLQSGNHGAEHWAHYALEGMINALLSNDPNMVALRRMADFFVYPDVNPEGNLCGYWRSTPVNAVDDHNRVWADENTYIANPTKNPEVALVEAAQRADAGTCEYFFDVHGQWERNNYPTYPDNSYSFAYGSPFQQNYLKVDPTSAGKAVAWGGDPRFAMGYAYCPVDKGGLAGTCTMSPEIGMIPGQTADNNRQLGYYYMTALYTTLAYPLNNFPPVVSVGPDQAIPLYYGHVTLSGTMSDDWLPVGAPLPAPGALCPARPRSLSPTPIPLSRRPPSLRRELTCCACWRLIRSS